MVEEGARNPPSEDLKGEPKIRPRLVRPEKEMNTHLRTVNLIDEITLI